MVWLEVINRKTAQAVYQKVVERILLEEGCPRVILTDNGTEFKNDLRACQDGLSSLVPAMYTVEHT